MRTLKTVTEKQMFSSVLVDGCPRELLPSNLSEALDRAGLLKAGSVSATGLVRLGVHNNLNIILPKGISDNLHFTNAENYSSLEDLKKAFLTIRIINRCLKEQRFQSRYIDSGQFFTSNRLNDAGLIDAIEAAFLLRKDFIENGLYWQKERQRRLDSYGHPINWPGTIGAYPPDLGEGVITFVHTVHSARARQPRDFLHRLHATCVNDVFQALGENRNVAEGRQLDDSEYATVLANPEAVILPLLGRTYRERGREILQLMLSWLRGRAMYKANKGNQAEVTGFCCNFHCIWEHMLRELLDNSGPNDRLLERGLWQGAGEAGEVKTKSPEIDLRRVESIGKNEVPVDSIIDAKYKRVVRGTRCGSAGDHYKQIIYALLSEHDRKGLLFNVLLFPASGYKETFTLLGCHRWVSIQNSDVFEVAVDIETIANSWLQGKRSRVQSDFSSFVQLTCLH